ncbi:exonuclease [Leclercia sp. AS011]|uniref:exonuclease n=1 Tax=Leclercia sp. AS011 TaxID=3081257 RepID=UPI0030181452
MEFFYHIKATQKSGKPDGVIWFSANTASRAALQLDVALEDVGIETGRGKDYAKPVRTDMPVVDDLPEEGVIDYTWCKCYELADDQRTWNVIAGTAQQPHPDGKVVEGTDTTIVDSVDIETGESIVDADGTETVCDAVREFRERKLPVLTTVATLPFRQRLLAQFIADKQYLYHVDEEQKKAILELELDVDNSYVQNLILAAENVEGFKKAHEPDIWKVVSALKTIFPVDGKRTELSVVIQFFKAWFNTGHIDRGILTREWAAGNRINLVQRTDSGTNADGGYVTDRGADTQHTLDTLDLEIACALLPMDFNHREIPGSIARRAKEIIANKEEPWKSWSKILRNQPGVLAVNRAAIFNLVRIAPEDIHLNPVAHLEFVNQTMTAEFNAATELLPLPAPAAEPEVPAAQPGGGGKTDRNPNYKPDFDGLDTEIALATLSADFNIYDIPSDVFRQAKAIVAANDSPFKEWSEALRATPGILDYSRAAIFALIRSAHPEHYKQPGRLSGYIKANLTEIDHENPTAEVLAAARHTPEVSWEKEINEKIEAEKAALVSQPQVANLGGGMFSIEGLMNENQSQTDDRSSVIEETTSDVQMEETDPTEGESVDAVPPGESTDAADPQTASLNPAEVLTAAAPILENQYQADVNQKPDSVSQNSNSINQNEPEPARNEPEAHQDEPAMFTHLMVDLETMGKKPGAPIVSVGAVFFDPASGKTGAEFYQVISLESSMSFGARPDASTILWWLKQSPEARSAIVVDDTVGLVEALEQFLDFIAENAANGSKNVQLWGNGSSFDCSLLEAAFELADTPFPIPHWNYRDVRTVVELGKAVGLNSRYDIPFEGDQHNALADARHQVKYVSAIWQRLTAI